MTHHRLHEPRQPPAILALATAGALWGLTVPLSKLALGWLAPGWLTVARFVLAAPALALLGQRGLRAACTPQIAATGALGYGAVIVLQNAGIERTSVSHAAVLLGAVPVLVALIAAGAVRSSAARAGAENGAAATAHTAPGRTGWGGYTLAIAGIALVARGSGGGSTVLGDALVLASTVLSAAFITFQPRLLAGRDTAAVTAVQVAAGGLLAAPIAVLTGPLPHAPANGGVVAALIALAVAGTLLPFWLFAYGQTQVPASLAGAFVNLEPVIGAAVGWLAFGNPAGTWQLAGVVAVIVGIGLSTLPTRERRRPQLVACDG